MGLGNIHQITFNPANYDAGGRFRMSQLTGLGEYGIIDSTIDSDFLNVVGTSTNTQGVSKYSMAVTTGQYGILQSKIYHPYLNGKSQLIEITVTDFGSASGIQKSIGYYSSTAVAPYASGYDGFRLHKDENDAYSIEVWRGGTRIIQSLQANWTLDRLDGTGNSGYDMDNSNFQWFGFDFLFLGGTAIRCFTFVNGSLVLFNVIPWVGSANVDGNTIFNSPNKPIRTEIRSVSGNGTLSFVCALVASEGQVNKQTRQRIIPGPAAGLTLASGTVYALCGIRKATAYRDIYGFISKIEGAVSSNTVANNVSFELRSNPTVAGSPTWAALTGTPFETFTGAIGNTVTGGTIINSTYASVNKTNFLEFDSVSTDLGSTVNDTMDTLVLCATPVLGGNNILSTGGMQASWLGK